MNVLACCRRPKTQSSTWLIGSSLSLVAVSFLLIWIGRDLAAQALLLASFPIGLLIADSKMRRERPGRLVSYATLIYAFMLGVMRLGELI